MNSYLIILGTFFGLFLVLIMSPFLNKMQANALDFDFNDFKCIAMVGQNVSCDEDNGVTQTTTNIDNSNTDNSQDNDVNITDSFNPTNICGNNAAEGTNAIATSSNSSVICNNNLESDIPPSTISFS